MFARASLKFNLLASWSAHAVSLFVGFFLMPYVLHQLGDTRYGTWLFINSIAGYAGLMYLGMGPTVSRFVARHFANRDWDRLNQVLNVILALYGIMSLVGVALAIGLACFAPSLHDWDGISDSEIRLVILLLGVNVGVGMVGSVFGGVLLGAQRFDLERLSAILADVARIGLTLMFVRGDCGLLPVAWICLGITVLECGAAVLFAFRAVPQLQLARRYLRWTTLRECFGFSLFALIGHVAAQLIYATDTFVIGVVLGNKAIVPYYIALRLCQFLRRPLQSIGEVCMPKAGELHARSDRRALHEMIVQWMGTTLLLSAGLFIGAAYFGDGLIDNWVGSGYDSSHAILIVLLASQVIALPLDVLRQIMFGMGYVRGPSLMYLVEAAANVVLSLALIQPLGILGVALGTAIPIVVVELFWLIPYAFRRVELRTAAALRAVLWPQVLPLCALWAYSSFVNSHLEIGGSWLRLVLVAAGGVGVLLAVWRLELRIPGWLKSSGAGSVDRRSSTGAKSEPLVVAGVK